MEVKETLCTRCEHGKVCRHTESLRSLTEKTDQLCKPGEMFTIEIRASTGNKQFQIQGDKRKRGESMKWAPEVE